MRFRPFLLLAWPLLLAACEKTDAPVQLDLIGSTGLTSGNATVSAGDTLTTRVYAVGNDNDLTHLRITVGYEPMRVPFLYPTPLSSFDAKNVPNDPGLIYLDSALALTSPPNERFSGRELLLVNKFSARTTSGTEQWVYTVADAKQQEASRALRLTVRKPDSLAVYHNYTAVLRPVPPSAGTPTAAAYLLRNQARAFVSLRSGLVLPKHALLNQQNTLQNNQPLVDLICVATNNSISLHAPAAASVAANLPATRWPLANRQRTQLRRTALTPAGFTSAVTAPSFAAAFAAGTALSADSLSTGVLAKNDVLAFRTAEGLNGLLLVADLTTGTAPVLNCNIKVEKRSLP